MQHFNLPPALAARIDALPPKLSVRQLAEFFKEKIPTIRQQIRRKTFPVTVHCIEGGQQYSTLADLIKFCIDGQAQPQPPLILRASRNPYGRKGKAGRPSKKALAVRAQAASLTAAGTI